MNTTAPTSPTKRGPALAPGAQKKIIKFVEGLQRSDKQFQIFKDKLNERFNQSKRPRNKLPSLTTSFDAARLPDLSAPLSGRESSTR